MFLVPRQPLTTVLQEAILKALSSDNVFSRVSDKGLDPGGSLHVGFSPPEHRLPVEPVHCLPCVHQQHVRSTISKTNLLLFKSKYLINEPSFHDPALAMANLPPLVDSVFVQLQCSSFFH